MARIQCKMCGGIVDVPEGVASGECPYCGSVTTFPKANAARLEQMYERAEHFRQVNDFDKATFAFEAIIREYPEEPDAYWGLVLSRFGIEYVEEKSTGKRIPTCHRVQSTSILSDSDYKTALSLSEGTYEHDLYKAEAQRIAGIQKGILDISAREAPFDVFICYKENTEGGSRSEESVIGQEIYQRLGKEGFNVFYARETLKDKMGQQYEPYIFAALNSAKVMLAIGTSRECFNAVWVKNEWSRFLSLMRDDRTKALIPCYKNMQATDLPEELSMFQALDMSQIGFLQDLIQGIKNILANNARHNGASSSTANQAQVDTSPSAALIRRIKVFMENGDFDRALENCEKAIDIDPENGEIYMLKIMSRSKIRNEEELYTNHCENILKNKDESWDSNTYHLFQKYADESLKNFYKSAWLYQIAVSDMRRAKTAQAWEAAIKRFEKLAGVKDADELKKRCMEEFVKAKEKENRILGQLDTQLNALIANNGNVKLEEYIKLIEQYEDMHCEIGDEKAKTCFFQIYKKLERDKLLCTPEEFEKFLWFLERKAERWPEIADLGKKCKEAHETNTSRGCLYTIAFIIVLVVVIFFSCKLI